jgi:hypothetical protein
MRKKYQNVWKKAEPLLKKAKKKDFVIHSRMVTRAMEEIIAGEGGDPDILIPAAMLHDVGWSDVPLELQFAKDKDKSHEALVQHIEKAPPIIRKILGELKYSDENISRIIDIVIAHSSDPKDKDKQMLIDADTLSDTYKESFYSDVESYNSTPEKTWKFRSKNTFYTKTAKEIFQRQLAARREEIDKT